MFHQLENIFLANHLQTHEQIITSKQRIFNLSHVQQWCKRRGCSAAFGCRYYRLQYFLCLQYLVFYFS